VHILWSSEKEPDMVNIDWDEMSNLSELTLIVPTYNRKDYALRQMCFWSDSPATMHVLDGTNRFIDKERLRGLGKNIHYHHMPYSTQERLGKAIDLIDTEYVMFLCDDEFYIPSSLCHCIETLKARKELVACMGRCLGFYFLPSGIVVKPMYVEMKGHRIEAETTRERMIAQMNPYVSSTFFSVMHSDVWKRSIGIVAEEKHAITLVYANELQFELATCYQGKSVVIEDLMWLRNMYNKPINFKGHNRKLQFDEWLKDPRYVDEVSFFYENTASELAKIDGAEKETVLADFKSSVEAYLYYCKKRHLIVTVATLKNQIMQFVPERLKMQMQSARISRTWKPIMECAETMQKEGVNVDIRQLKEIVKYMGEHK